MNEPSPGIAINTSKVLNDSIGNLGACSHASNGKFLFEFGSGRWIASLFTLLFAPFWDMGECKNINGLFPDHRMFRQ